MNGRVKKYINKICRDNHIHYTSLRLVFSIIMCLLMVTHWCYPYLNLLCMHACGRNNIPCRLVDRGWGHNHCCITARLLYSCTYSRSKRRYVKWMWLSLQILFVYFLTLPSLLHPSSSLFFILVSILFIPLYGNSSMPSDMIFPLTKSWLGYSRQRQLTDTLSSHIIIMFIQSTV